MNQEPCPFCGSNDLRFHHFDLQESRNRSPDTESVGIRCNDCGSIGGVFDIELKYHSGVIINDYKDLERQSWNSWNHRSYSYNETVNEIKKYDEEIKIYVK